MGAAGNNHIVLQTFKNAAKTAAENWRATGTQTPNPPIPLVKRKDSLRANGQTTIYRSPNPMEAVGNNALELRIFKNTAETAATNSKVLELLQSWLDDHFHTLKCEWSKKTQRRLDKATENQLEGHRRRFYLPAEQTSLFRKIARTMAKDAARALDAGKLESQAYPSGVEALAFNLGLTPLQQDIVHLARASMDSEALEDLIMRLCRTGGGVEGGVAIALGSTREEVHKSFWEPETGLIDLGVLDPEYRRAVYDTFARILRAPVKEAITKPITDPFELERDLLGAPCEAEISYEQFDHVMRERDFIVGALRGSVNAKAEGVNVLIYGPPGTGKTELAKTVCKYLGLKLFAVGEKTRLDQEEHDRLGALLMAQKLLGKRGKAVLLFDEMEDIADDCFGNFGSDRPVSSKVFLNRILEQNQTPVIWVANHPHILGESVLRRMSYVAKLDVPDHKVRAQMFKAACERKGLKIDHEKLDEIARDFAVPPALIEKAAETANFVEGGSGHIHHVITGLAKASGYADPNKAETKKKDEAAYDLSLINVKGDGPAPETLIERLKSASTKSFSLCLNGAPGTGKTAFAKYLAKSLDLPLIEKRASDILRPFVGESEMAIAGAFKESKRREGLLFIDEADSLLSDRRHASQSWQVSQVNELLAQMQDHPYPIVMATNFIDHLDQASLRRFTFKLEFGFLTSDQVAKAFEVFFQLEAPEKVRNMDLLTAGDFATVRKKASILGELEAVDALAKYLDEEIQAKVEFGGQRRRMGFGH